LDLLTRRTVLKNTLLGSLTALTGSIAARAESRVEGPLVWLDMDQEALDLAYTQSHYAPNIRQVIARWNTSSAIVRSHIGNPQRFSYGEKSIEELDVFSTDRPDAPVHIYIHGGAWQQGKAETYAFPAEMFINAGAHYVVPNFSWVQDVGDSLFPIADQVRRAVAWVYRNADKFGGNTERIYLSGHSSGGHLAGVILTTDWQQEFGLPADIIKGGLCASGMFDLKPVRLSARGNYIAFTDEMEHDLSPIRHLGKINAPLIVAYGTYETPEFKRQSEDFAKAVADAGKPVRLIVAENYNHFEIIETLANPYGVLGRAVLEQMKLPAPMQ
jgi:arylformamidase